MQMSVQLRGWQPRPPERIPLAEPRVATRGHSRRDSRLHQAWLAGQESPARQKGRVEWLLPTPRTPVRWRIEEWRLLPLEETAPLVPWSEARPAWAGESLAVLPVHRRGQTGPPWRHALRSESFDPGAAALHRAQQGSNPQVFREKAPGSRIPDTWPPCRSHPAALSAVAGSEGTEI